MNNCIEDIIKAICPEAQNVTFMDAHRLIEAVTQKEPSIVSIIHNSFMHKTALPIVTYGFETHGSLKQNYDNEILAMAKYLLLPTTTQDLHLAISSLQQPSRYNATKDYFVSFAIRQVREFRHRFDNHWMALSVHASSARKESPNLSANSSSSMTVFSEAMIQDRALEYENIRVYVDFLALPGRKRIHGIFKKLQKNLSTVAGLDLLQAVPIAFSCVEGFKEISEILAKAKEIDICK